MHPNFSVFFYWDVVAVNDKVFWWRGSYLQASTLATQTVAFLQNGYRW